MSKPLTPEQHAIIEALTTTENNLIVEALAGSGKTSTIVAMTQALTVPSLAIAFNKRIAEELQTRLPKHVEAKTFHGMCYRFCAQHLKRRKLQVENGKKSRILRAVIDQHAPKDREALQETFMDMLKALGYGAEAGYLPDGGNPAGTIFDNARPLMSNGEFFNAPSVDTSRVDWTSLEEEVLIAATNQNFKECLDGTFDFSDMLLFAAVLPVPMWIPITAKPKIIYVDEAQDLSAIQHRILGRMVGPKGRIVAVGDECQAIYGFRGAHQDSMALLRKQFSMTPLPLSVTFRCPSSVAEHVRWRAPHIQSPEWAKPGSVETLSEWNESSIPDGAAIICRNNAPLFKTALRLLRSNRRPRLVGNDVVKALVKDMKSLSKDMKLASEHALTFLDEWKTKNLKKYRNSPRIHDKAECIKLFFEESETLGEAIHRCESIANMTGAISLMTGHKSKGLEFPAVFFLDEFLIDPERDPQANNLRYVICTRAEEKLVYIESAGWTGPDSEGAA